MYLLKAIQCLGRYAGSDKDDGRAGWHYANDNSGSCSL